VPTILSINLWHKNIGHLNYQPLYHLSNKDMVLGVPKLLLIKQMCETCIFVKHHRDWIPKQSKTPTTWALVNHIFRYVKKTSDYGILYKRTGDGTIYGYTDGDWDSCKETCRSTGGYLFTMVGGLLT
jgi:hypothetical protein